VEVIEAPGAIVYASLGRRLFSAVIDSFAISLLSAPFVGGAASRVLEALSEGTPVDSADLRAVTLTNLFATVTYMTALHGWRGSTLGKMAARTVLVRDDGSRVMPSVAFVRAVTVAGTQFVSSLLLFPIVVDMLAPLWSPRRQTLHDRLAKTIVVRVSSVRPVGET
jgi:uncharacterized RDD family membrane protein YckC